MSRKTNVVKLLVMSIVATYGTIEYYFTGDILYLILSAVFLTVLILVHKEVDNREAPR
ncbi:MAG: hypothetical protein QW123_00035 [Desulfurococcaceae archaeon]|jgi:hypothetical protein